MSSMSAEERRKVYEMRYKAKKGGALTDEEMDFAKEMFERHPDEYRKIGKEVLERVRAEVNPFL